MSEAIIITLTNNEQIIWRSDEWDDYSYEDKVFVVIKNGVWKGIYNMNFVKHVRVR